MLSGRTEDIGPAFFLSRLNSALAHRRRIVSATTAYRLVHGEADLLPALIVDRYGDYFTVQTLNQGMDACRGMIVDALQEVLPAKGIVARNDVSVRKHENLPPETVILRGEIPQTVPVEMNGMTWDVDLLGGQKTGIYLDQRENYLAAAKFGKGRALDCFTSTGGFALHLARSCESVEGIDSSASALDSARHNQGKNGISKVTWTQADVFDILPQYFQAGRRFSTIVLDPPAFTKTRGAREGAARGYKEINFRALRLLTEGGVLVTCSCSHHFSEPDLLETVAAAALDAGRTLRVLDRRTQALDHPILLTVPETHYLKCLIFEAV